MTIKMIKGITSEFEQHGLYLRNENRSDITYASPANDINVVFELTNRCPPSLFPTFLRLMKEENIKKEPPALRVLYAINISGHWYPINIELFITGKTIQPAFFCRNKQELLDAAEKLVRLIIDDILPCSKELIDNPVRSTYDMHERLSANPQEIAKAFSERYHFPLVSLKESSNLVRELLDGIIPPDIAKRPGVFHENEELVIGAAAYLGEATIQEYHGRWAWLRDLALPREFDNMDKNIFVVESSDFETYYFTPFGSLEAHWTFHNKVAAWGLDQFTPPW